MARGGHLPFATRSAVKRTPLKKGLRLNGHRLWQSRCNVVQNDKPYVDGVEVRRCCTMRRCCTIHSDQRVDDDAGEPRPPRACGRRRAPGP